MTTTKKKKPVNSTLRNVGAANKRFFALENRIRNLEAIVSVLLVQNEAPVSLVKKPPAKKR